MGYLAGERNVERFKETKDSKGVGSREEEVDTKHKKVPFQRK